MQASITCVLDKQVTIRFFMVTYPSVPRSRLPAGVKNKVKPNADKETLKLNFFFNFGEKGGGGGICLVISYTPPSLLFLVACLLLLFVWNNLGIRQDVFTFAILLLSFVFCYRIVVVFFYPSPSFFFFFQNCVWRWIVWPNFLSSHQKDPVIVLNALDTLITVFFL